MSAASADNTSESWQVQPRPSIGLGLQVRPYAGSSAGRPGPAGPGRAATAPGPGVATQCTLWARGRLIGPSGAAHRQRQAGAVAGDLRWPALAHHSAGPARPMRWATRRRYTKIHTKIEIHRIHMQIKINFLCIAVYRYSKFAVLTTNSLLLRYSNPNEQQSVNKQTF